MINIGKNKILHSREFMDLDRIFENKSIEDVISYFKALSEKTKADSNCTTHFTVEYDYDMTYVWLEVYRLESDLELSQRNQREIKEAQIKEDEERKEYERLRAKFGE